MIQNVDFYYFSPTGGTKKVGDLFCSAIAEQVHSVNLGDRTAEVLDGSSALTVVAAPVYAGRIPAYVADRLKALNGNGKKAAALVVYGVRAYDDALLELKNVLTDCGFDVIAGGAFVAQHSIVNFVGAGRPDEKDAEQIKEFAVKVEEKLVSGAAGAVEVPGNMPYRDGMKVAAPPMCTEECKLCGKCIDACPTGAITLEEDKVVTELSKCMLCMACTAVCARGARVLPPPLQDGMNQKLGALKDVYRENEYYL